VADRGAALKAAPFSRGALTSRPCRAIVTTNNALVEEAAAMARRREERKLGELELRIMNVLWQRGPSTVREVLEALSVRPRPAYTTVLTMMRLMYEKGYLDRREQGRAHVYQAKLRERPTKGTLLKGLIDSAFGGSAEALMVRLIEDEKLSPEEIERVKKLIAEHERRGNKDVHR